MPLDFSGSAEEFAEPLYLGLFGRVAVSVTVWEAADLLGHRAASQEDQDCSHASRDRDF
jgi:hypothetical protein